MITSKQRAKLRGMANDIDTLFQVGKSGVTPEVIQSTAEALQKRELIKLRVLENSLLSAREAAVALSEATGADVVQVIGSRFVLYKPNPKEPVIQL
ncbi:MAG TPA: YhbY family RNA-binding protein [Firmicutes bacterium]|nr:YhbY family RNA-binding protein [Bacillota bacterium]